MTLMDTVSSTAFAIRSSPSNGASGGGGAGAGVLDQPSGRAISSAATRLGTIESAPPSDGKERGPGAPPPPPPGPLFSFGAIADVQYADQEDGWNFRKDYRRYYRGGLLKLRGAVDWWLQDETHRQCHCALFLSSFCSVNNCLLWRRRLCERSRRGRRELWWSGPWTIFVFSLKLSRTLLKLSPTL